MRKKMVAGNWKMNNTISESLQYLDVIKDKINNNDIDVVFCVPSLNIMKIQDKLENTKINVGCQNMHFEESGAFTGEISAKMLKEAKVQYVIVGHSERRQYFGENNEIVNKKTVQALKHGLTPITCVGETLENREQGITIELVRTQVKVALNNVSKDDVVKVILAYEPIWAIGTGVTATSAQAEEVCKEIRKVLTEIYDKETSDKVRILYGGSVNGKNAKELFSMENIDGGLVGGASLKPEFEQVVNYLEGK